MTDHLSHNEIELYRSGTASPADLLAFDDHLALCGACRAQAAAGENAGELLTSLRAGLKEMQADEAEHLAYAELSAYVDNSLGEVEREIAESHLAVCQSCEDEVRALQDFKETAAPKFHQPYAPAIARPTPSEPRQNVLSFLWPSSLNWSPLRAALAGAAVLIVAIGAVLLLWKLRTNESMDVAQTPTPSPTVSTSNGDPNTNGGNNLPPDTTPMPAEGATEILLALNDGGGRVTLDAEGNLAGVESLAPAQAEAIKIALRTQRAVNLSALAGIRGRSGVLRDGQQSGVPFAVRSPVGIIVESTRLVLRWDTLAGATSYKVTIYDANFNAVATSPALMTTSWTVAPSLARGNIYTWQVTAMKDGEEIKSPQPPAPEAKFKVLDGAKAAEIQQARQAHPTSHLTLGVLYAQAGLLADAEREFGALLRANPNSEVARKLLNNVRAAKK